MNLPIALFDSRTQSSDRRPTPVDTRLERSEMNPVPSRPYADEAGSGPIRQVEVRAVFRVDRELSEDELLQRSRALPGVRTLVRVAECDVASIEAAIRVLHRLGFEGSTRTAVRLVCDNAPVEFIREGRVRLAVLGEGQFPPGVWETLLIVARELGRMESAGVLR